MTITPLTNQIAAKIVQIVQSSPEPFGMRLVERKLAEQLKVSRSPVRGALKLLEEQGFIKQNPSGRMLVSWQGGPLPIFTSDQLLDNEDEIYRKIAEDRLSGDLPDKMTENQLLRRYDVGRGVLANVLRRIAGEGWIQRLPGHGWEFLQILTSMKTYRDSFRFRLSIEPTAILEPTFVVVESALEMRLEQQSKLLAGEIWTISQPDLFDLNTGLHETIIEFSNNPFFIESLRRINRLRRLMDYKNAIDREAAVVRSQEHVTLIKHLLSGDLETASSFMTYHLSSVASLKTIDRPK